MWEALNWIDLSYESRTFSNMKINFQVTKKLYIYLLVENPSVID
jgi:hypothetical protein